jgi:hypothetical protein
MKPRHLAPSTSAASEILTLLESLAGDRADPPAPPLPAPVPVRNRHHGWTAKRQREFLTVLAETGSISQACVQAGVSSRSAYRLRARADAGAFAAAWDQALQLATTRLVTLAFERATRGTVREYFRHGEMVAQTRAPSDRMLMFLLNHLLARDTAGAAGLMTAAAQARDGFPAVLDALTDNKVEMVPITVEDFHDTAPGWQDDQS